MNLHRTARRHVLEDGTLQPEDSLVCSVLRSYVNIVFTVLKLHCLYSHLYAQEGLNLIIRNTQTHNILLWCELRFADPSHHV
jgi:hypothetical protein